MAKKVCSFCGRGENEVKLLITGLSGYICENCAHQAYEIVQSAGLAEEEQHSGGKDSSFKINKVPKPKDIKDRKSVV